ncbi:MAG TPA: IS30 family transposase [Rhodanobacter sp.]
MARRKRRLNFQEARELWARWKEGQTLAEIGAALGGRAKSSVFDALQACGGVAPRQRVRSARHLSEQEREEISRGLVAGTSVRQLARQLGRSPSTISREICRNGGAQAYRAAAADQRARKQAQRPKACVLASNDRLRDVIAQRLQHDWSPQQISGWLKVIHHNEPAMQISHETIYRSLFIQARGVLKKELISHLRSGRAMRRGKTSTLKGRVGGIVDAICIRERPAEAEDRAVPGHWEGDLISGSRNTHIATLVERRSRYVLLVRVENKETATVVNALTQQVQRLPEGLMATLTWDQGKEMAAHKQFTVATDVQVYFCDPRSPWQRGSNENTNGLLRQYFPKGTDLSGFTQEHLDAVADRLNTRPRKTLGYRTPAATLAETVAITG